MTNHQRLTRRTLLQQLALGGGVLALTQAGTPAGAQTPPQDYVLDKKHLEPLKLKGRIKQSAARGAYRRVKIDDLCQAAKALGMVGLDLVNNREEWPVLKKYGLQATMVSGAGTIPDGFNRKENHDRLVESFRGNAQAASQAGWKNVITFSGNRNGLPDGEGLENCVLGISRLKSLAEEFNVTVCIELLNSKVNHPDYQFDHMAWGVELVKRINHPRIKILYDIYHAQIMDGDIIRTIKDNIQWIGHFHTGGVPGRHELDETQELNWRAIMQVIADLKFDGVVAHEFSPTKPDPLVSLREAVVLCDV